MSYYTINLKRISKECSIEPYTKIGLQVCSTMWLRTTLNYQYKNRLSFTNTLKILYKEGGISRFYRGFTPNLIHTPLARFGDIYANFAILHYFKNLENLENNNNNINNQFNSNINNHINIDNYNLAIYTFYGSILSGLWRVSILPLDTCKIICQVQGKNGYNILRNKINVGGLRVLYYGGLGAFSSTIISYFPWFLTYNYLNNFIDSNNKKILFSNSNILNDKDVNIKQNSDIKQYPDSKYNNDTINNLCKYTFICFTSSVISDIVSNFINVIKVSKQSSKNLLSYDKVINNIINKNGYKELFTRGLKTRIIINGIQGVIIVLFLI